MIASHSQGSVPSARAVRCHSIWNAGTISLPSANVSASAAAITTRSPAAAMATSRQRGTSRPRYASASVPESRVASTSVTISTGLPTSV